MNIIANILYMQQLDKLFKLIFLDLLEYLAMCLLIFHKTCAHQ